MKVNIHIETKLTYTHTIAFDAPDEWQDNDIDNVYFDAERVKNSLNADPCCCGIDDFVSEIKKIYQDAELIEDMSPENKFTDVDVIEQK